MKTLKRHIVTAKSDWHTYPRLCGGLLGSLITLVVITATIVVARGGVW